MKIMDIGVALDIVYQLAEQNVLDPKTCDGEMINEAMRQACALNTVHDFIVNGYEEEECE